MDDTQRQPPRATSGHGWQAADREALVLRAEHEPMWMTPHMATLAQLGRGLGDPVRIYILALLAESAQPLYGQELAERLQVSPQTISHHLGILKQVGLVRERRENTYRYYSLDSERIQQIRAAAFSDDRLGLPSRADERESVLAVFFADGRLVSIPNQRAKRRYILEELAHAFTWGRLYVEREVNEILKRFHEDTARLRRDLVEEGFMLREHGRYWLVRPHDVADKPADEPASDEPASDEA